MNQNENRRIPGFTAEKALEQRAATPYAGLASRGAGGGAVEPAFCHRTTFGELICCYDGHCFPVLPHFGTGSL